MRFSATSFVLGLAAASLAPIVTRVFRPLAVETAAAAMGLIEDARRIVAEQMEGVEDIVAEARARREHLDAEAALSFEEAAAVNGDAPVDTPDTSRPRRRGRVGTRARA